MRERERVVHPEGGDSLTKQSLAGATDINVLLERWMKHGEAVVHLNRREGAYGDFSSGVDYQEALNSIQAAQREFAALPADVRSHCDNDAAEFLAMIFDPERREEVERLGLVDSTEPDAAARAPEGADGESSESLKVKLSEAEAREAREVEESAKGE